MLYTPCYDVKELDALLKHWAFNSLNGIMSAGGVRPGNRDCEMAAGGLRATGLLRRYTSDDVDAVISEMGQAEDPQPLQASILLLKSLGYHPISDIARALNIDCSKAQGQLTAAQDQFVAKLLATS